MAPAAAPTTAARTAACHPELSISTPPIAAPDERPATSAVSGQVSASVFVPGGAVALASSLRVAMIGAISTPAGISINAITGMDGARSGGTNASGSRSVKR
jgi:hypothetical protein